MPAEMNSAQQNNAEGGRNAARHAMPMLRSAKLVCQSGEYFCVIRDVSADGVGLCFRHNVPPESRVILQLENGDTYPIERVWSGKQQSGYRFASPIVLSEFIHEASPYQQRPIRLRIAADTQCIVGGVSHKVRLIDLSCGGASIETGSEIGGEIGREDRARFELPGLPPRIADICWRKGQTYGLSFQNSLTIEELALAALDLQPFGTYRPVEQPQPPVRRGLAA